MKINQDYPVRSDKYNTMHPAKDYYLQGNKGPKTEGVFPAELAETDFFIQDPRYLSAYANFFCKFVSAYKELNIPIKMVMFQMNRGAIRLIRDVHGHRRELSVSM